LALSLKDGQESGLLDVSLPNRFAKKTKGDQRFSEKFLRKTSLPGKNVSRGPIVSGSKAARKIVPLENKDAGLQARRSSTTFAENA
jgi:hypothetical protein